MPPHSPPRSPPPPCSTISAFLRSFDIDPVHGFLPSSWPLPRLPYLAFQAHEDLAAVLPQLLVSSTARAAIEALPLVKSTSTRNLFNNNEPAQRRALLLFGGLASAYVWGGGTDVTPRDYLPACIAVPLYEVARMLETCPILSHQSNCLYNWKKGASEKAKEKGGNVNRMHNGDEDACSDSDNPSNPLQAQNLALTFSFTGDDNERMFYLLSLEIEVVGARALPLLETARRAAHHLLKASFPCSWKGDEGEENGMKTEQHQQQQQQQHQQEVYLQQESREVEEKAIIDTLIQVRACIRACQSILLSMPRHVDPVFFFHRIRPYLSGWRNNPSVPQGIIYRGVVVGEGEGGGEVGGGRGQGRGRGREDAGQSSNENEHQQEGDNYSEQELDERGPRLSYSGGSAAQSSLLPSLDLYLGVNHDEAGTRSQSSYQFVKAMRAYMPKGHRRFLEALEEDVKIEDEEEGREKRMSIRRYVLWRCEECEGGKEERKEDGLRLVRAYDGCVEALVAFRMSHLGIVRLYITHQQGGKGGRKTGGGGLEEAAGGKGTGGQAPKEFLKPLRDQTAAALLEGKVKGV
ncbi:indoleamine-dioxygenase [Nannochloropsis oceanica]